MVFIVGAYIGPADETGVRRKLNKTVCCTEWRTKIGKGVMERSEKMQHSYKLARLSNVLH